jgi:phosphopantothenoylcysteine decarboxylase/phosphopantothenate--cysteine ligase
MESKMYGHPATQRHLRRLAERGISAIGPAAGRLASGAQGLGRLVEPAELVAELERILAQKSELDLS